MGIFSVVPTVLLRKTTRSEFTIAKLIDGLEAGAVNSVIVAMACASAGIVIGVIAQTGLGLTFTGVVRAAAGRHAAAGLILTMVAGIILGMGMPTTPAYIVQVALLVPALVRLGVPVESAHMFVFYFAVLSAITPPVAIAVYAACGIARSDVWATSFIAVKLGLTGYIIPFMFVYGPSLLLIGEWHTIVLSAITACAGVTLLAAGLSGWLIGHANPAARLCYVGAAFVLINPGLVTDTVRCGAGRGRNRAERVLEVDAGAPPAARKRCSATSRRPEHAPIEPTDLIETPPRRRAAANCESVRT
jgi:TRAP-type uncharacterized transport system fused permease subunit